MRHLLLVSAAVICPVAAVQAQPVTTPPAERAPVPTPPPAGTPPQAEADAPAETPPAVAEEVPPPEETEEIVVRAQSEQRTSIDRETYLVRDTAQARTSNALDILGRIPSVTVQPDNSVRLLGTTGVTVLVDGRPSPNPNVLRDLQGSEISRVEVVSNPSAQFSASGTGGVINIITRTNALDGLRGSVTVSAGRYDSYEARVAPSYTSGPWTISGNLGVTRQGTEFESLRERLSLDPTSPAPDTFETSQGEGRFLFGNANGTISYRPSDKQTITFQGGAIRGDSDNVTNSLLQIEGAAGPGISQRIDSEFSFQAYNASLEYRAEGSRPGQLLTASIQQQRFDPTQTVLTEFDVGDFLFTADGFTRSRIAKVDFVRPTASGSRLLVGGQANDTYEYNRIEQSGDLVLGGNAFPPVSVIDGSFFEGALYASYQFPLFGGTLLAGVRGEGRRYEFADPALGEGPSDLYLFPSFSFERQLAPWVTATLSYSRRIAWPQVQQLSPALRFSDAVTAQGGNPLLRPELTDAFEARFRGQLLGQTVLLTLFNRRTSDLYSSLAELTDEGVLITRPINIGTRNDTGAAIAVQGGIIQGLNYSLNANILARSVEREVAGFTFVEDSANYSATAQLDYRDGVDGRAGADRVTLNLTYSGPYDDGLIQRSAFFRGSVSWSHAITDRLSSIVTLDDVFGPTEFRTTTLSGTALTRSSFFSDGPRFKLALTYSLGRPGQPQPPATAPGGPVTPGIPIPGQ